MKYSRLLAPVVLIGLTLDSASAIEPVTSFYIGMDAASLALDGDRVVGVPTRSPGHTSKVGSVVLGARFGDDTAADVSFGTDLSNNVDVDAFSINAYRYFGTDKWRPFVTGGLSTFSIDEATRDDSTRQLQIGGGIAGTLSDGLEMQIGYRHYFNLGGESYDDDAFNVALKWNFGAAPVTVEPAEVVAAAPEPAPQPKVIEKRTLLVEFDFDKSDIRRAYEPQFAEIAGIVNDDPRIGLTIEGHTDHVGTDEYNQSLSERRAAAVRDKFVAEYGVPSDRIRSEGFGESKPIADNSTAEGRQRNRRAVAVILELKPN